LRRLLVVHHHVVFYADIKLGSHFCVQDLVYFRNFSFSIFATFKLCIEALPHNCHFEYKISVQYIKLLLLSPYLKNNNEVFHHGSNYIADEDAVLYHGVMVIIANCGADCSIKCCNEHVNKNHTSDFDTAAIFGECLDMSFSQVLIFSNVTAFIGCCKIQIYKAIEQKCSNKK
jgi:hypothetical protein